MKINSIAHAWMGRVSEVAKNDELGFQKAHFVELGLRSLAENFRPQREEAIQALDELRRGAGLTRLTCPIFFKSDTQSLSPEELREVLLAVKDAGEENGLRDIEWVFDAAQNIFLSANLCVLPDSAAISDLGLGAVQGSRGGEIDIEKILTQRLGIQTLGEIRLLHLDDFNFLISRALASSHGGGMRWSPLRLLKIQMSFLKPIF